MTPLRPDLPVVLGLAVLLALAVGSSAAGSLGHARGVLTAGVRASVQLGVLALLLAAVLRSGWLSAGFLFLMLGVASWTSAGRISGPPGFAWRALASIGLPAAVVLGVVVATGAAPRSPLALLPIGGIVIGGAMTATTLAGRRAMHDLRARRGEVEAALALGLAPREATRPVLVRSAADAVVPVLDQTRTVGLVTLPGVFVGLLLGGATPLQAGLAQLLVLVALLAAEAAAAALTVELVWRACWDGARFRLPEPAAPTGVVGPRGFRRIRRRG